MGKKSLYILNEIIWSTYTHLFLHLYHLMKSGPGCLDVPGSSTVGPPPRLPTASLHGQVPLFPQAEAVLGGQSHCGEVEAVAAYLRCCGA